MYGHNITLFDCVSIDFSLYAHAFLSFETSTGRGIKSDTGIKMNSGRKMMGRGDV